MLQVYHRKRLKNNTLFSSTSELYSIVVNVNKKEIVWESDPHLAPLMPGVIKPSDKTPNRYFCLKVKENAHEYSQIEVLEADELYFLKRSKKKCQFRIPINSFRDTKNDKVYRSGLIVSY